MKYKFIILRNESKIDYQLWEQSLVKHKEKIKYKVVNLLLDNWIDEIRSFEFDYLLAKPPGITSSLKQLYDERILILSKELNYPVFPTLDEILIYENKRYLSFWLKAHNLPHPKTNIFYFRAEAIQFLNNSDYPKVAKINIGASGKGVEILKNKREAEKYINSMFTTGKASKTGPNLKKGKKLKRALNALMNPSHLKERLSTYKAIANDPQKGFVILQEFIPHQFEWRVVRIGDSFFAHKKLKKGKMASGSLLKGYDNPPLSLFDFVKEVSDRFGFYSQAFDIFENENGEYLINEIQCIFGQSDPYQMLINGEPGRYVWNTDQWIFEPGNFNTNQSFDLRVSYILEKLENLRK